MSFASEASHYRRHHHHRRCNLDDSDCGDYKLLNIEKCACECPDGYGQDDCNKNEIWDDDYCTCYCPRHPPFSNPNPAKMYWSRSSCNYKCIKTLKCEFGNFNKTSCSCPTPLTTTTTTTKKTTTTTTTTPTTTTTTTPTTTTTTPTTTTTRFDFNKAKQSGTCKSCLKTVYWARERVAAHKRSSCQNATSEEKNFFMKRKNEASAQTSRTQFSNNTTQQNLCLTEDGNPILSRDTKDDIDMKLANFFYRTGISLRLVESDAFKEFVKSLNPTYTMPSAKTLSGSFLDKQFIKCSTSMNEILDSHINLCLITDGWTNIRGDHIVNFCVKAPTEKPFFHSSINTSGIIQNASAVAESIIAVLENLGSHKFNCIISDNAPVMKAAFKIIEEKYPHISGNGCAAHGVNLLVKDLITTTESSKTIKEAEKIIKYIKNHHLVKAKFDDIRLAANINHTLSMPVTTRWFSYFNSMSCLQNLKYVLIKLVDDEGEVLKEIQPKSNSNAVMSLIKSNLFWERLAKLVKMIEFPSNVIGKLEGDDSSLSLVYDYFGQLYNHYEDNPEIQEKVKSRLKFLLTPTMGLAFMLTPKNAAEGFYFDEDKVDFIASAFDFANKVNSDIADSIQDELVAFMSEMSSLTERRKEIVYKMSAKNYWSIIGREKYPALYQIAKPINEMICSSASSERTWSTFRFIHSRLRNKLTNERVKKLVFLYTNSVLMDAVDKNDYILDEGAILNENEYEEMNESM
ncbi:hypothetical protein PVAND_014724 [Polypedilum vanderplanki]|uniref:DUF659 domain-containing protein n=1 Tax=Polypedilum vanderplanki TaxID=319348 RepID=A0A9J6BAJ2_POLVA|nr:hypothetical protein PVAND_014724 [Polypedilum vanderplanki]